MHFYLNDSSKLKNVEHKNIIVLNHDNWDDWFTYSTVYYISYFDNDGILYKIGAVKIGQKNMSDQQRSPNLPKDFASLNLDFFSLGQDVSYYENLNKFGEQFRETVLNALNDIAFKSDLYSEVLYEHVTKISLLRSVSETSVEGQYRRLAQGIAELTSYHFTYKSNKSNNKELLLDFEVLPESTPPTNVHVVIGRNGVGKTHLFNNMINALLNGNKSNSKYGYFTSNIESSSKLFANLVSVSFSAFDESIPIIEEKRDKIKNLNYSYIGLKRIEKGNEKQPPKSPTMLKNEFIKSAQKCIIGSKSKRWIEALNTLESDPIFATAELSKIAENNFDEVFIEQASNSFNKLSSGHKIILLTITRLVETIEERSLVLIDEPEAYLHPPLLSAFIRALSDLLIKRNAVAIIGTHSPVVLQEVPKKCIWKLRRTGATAIAERLEIESFGENVGLLTQEIFGLEVTDAGFHKMLNKIAEESDSYDDAIKKLNDQIGQEARAILRNMIYKKKNEENK